MSNKIIRFFVTIICSLVCFFAYAEQFETQFSADSITVERGEILIAEGNVKVQHGPRYVKAKALNSKKTNEIEFIALRDFQDGEAINLSAEEAVISSDLSDGIIRTANLLINDLVRVQTGEVRLKDGQISSAAGISQGHHVKNVKERA